jgi:glutathionyl-hydroquinone reductase
MKEMSEYLLEQLMVEADDNKAEETITNEKEFRAAAKAKFEEVFGDDLDEERMKMTIDGILDDNPDLVKNNEWGELIGMLNKSFGK